jgi:uncharacterized repeat protein (TIGR04138 family)
MQAATFEEALELILAKDQRFHRDAYLFLREALDHTRKMLEREARSERASKRALNREQHVTGQELLAGIRELALETFGPMAITVFEEWGIRSCQDFGEVVFILVENGLLRKTERDSRSDFENGYDFHEAFRKPYLPRSAQSTGRKSPKLSKT